VHNYRVSIIWIAYALATDPWDVSLILRPFSSIKKEITTKFVISCARASSVNVASRTTWAGGLTLRSVYRRDLLKAAMGWLLSSGEYSYTLVNIGLGEGGWHVELYLHLTTSFDAFPFERPRFVVFERHRTKYPSRISATRIQPGYPYLLTY